MDGTEIPVSSACKQSADADLKQFENLFVELLAESTASDDTKLVDAMKWFKRASIAMKLQSQFAMLDLLFVDEKKENKFSDDELCIIG